MSLSVNELTMKLDSKFVRSLNLIFYSPDSQHHDKTIKCYEVNSKTL